MEKTFKFLFFLVLFTTYVKAENIDSIIKSYLKLVDKMPDDTIKLSTLAYISDYGPEGTWQTYNEKMKLLSLQLMASKDTFIVKKAKKNYALSLNNLGYDFVQKYNYSKALSTYDQCAAVRKEIGDRNGLCEVYTSVGAIYERQNINDKALEYYFKAFQLEKGNAFMTMIPTLYNIGFIYQKQNDNEKAMEYYRKAEQIIVQNKFINITVPSIYDGIGLLLELKKKNDSAMIYYNMGYDVAKKIGDNVGMARSLVKISELYYANGNNKEALKCAKEALELSIQANLILDQSKSADILRRLYATIGDYKNAYKMYDIQTKAKDLINSKDNQKAVISHQFQTDYEIKKATLKSEQEKKDAIAAKEIQKQKYVRNGFIGGTILFLLLAGAIFIGLQKTGKAKRKSDELLLNILPAEVAEELKETGGAKAKHFDNVTVLFTDFVNFTKVAETLSPQELVNELHACFKAFDDIIGKHGIEKIKTIGDAYLAVCGLPHANEQHPQKVVQAALEIVAFMQNRHQQLGNKTFEIRIGVNSGSVVAGIVGVKKFAYDIWGDTVNTAARMEQHSEAGKVNISGSTYELVKDQFHCEHRGKISAKGKGEIDMYFVG